MNNDRTTSLERKKPKPSGGGGGGGGRGLKCILLILYDDNYYIIMKILIIFYMLDCYSQRFFNHVGMISCLPCLNQFYAADIVPCLRTKHSKSAGGESQTSNRSIPSLIIFQQRYCASRKTQSKYS